MIRLALIRILKLGLGTILIRYYETRIRVNPTQSAIKLIFLSRLFNLIALPWKWRKRWQESTFFQSMKGFNSLFICSFGKRKNPRQGTKKSTTKEPHIKHSSHSSIQLHLFKFIHSLLLHSSKFICPNSFVQIHSFLIFQFLTKPRKRFRLITATTPASKKKI